MKRTLFAVSLLAATVAGCASAPLGPRVAVMPGPYKPLDVFESEDRYCRDYAQRAVAGQTQAADNAAVGSAVVGTAVGAVIGAAVGGHEGAAVGAGGGLMVGSASGSGRAYASERDIQRSYDVAYLQCMYSAGNQIPGQYAPRRSSSLPPPPPPNSSAAPPPPPPPPPSK